MLLSALRVYHLYSAFLHTCQVLGAFQHTSGTYIPNQLFKADDICCSGCISGFAATTAILAVIFDSILFFSSRARLNDPAIQGSSATIGNAIWLVIAAGAMLLVAPLVFAIGQCCSACCPSSRHNHKSHKRDREMGLGPIHPPHHKQYPHGSYNPSEYEPLTR